MYQGSPPGLASGIGLDDAKSNHILSLLPKEDFTRVAAYLEPIQLQSGEVLYQPGEQQTYAYFPTSCVVAFVQQEARGNATCVAMAGRDSMVGLSRVLQSRNGPRSAEVQTGGRAWRVPMETLQREFFRGGALMHLLLRLVHFNMTLMSQRAVCNRFHRVDQQVCGWLTYMQDLSQSDQIEASQGRLAQLLGVRRQGVSEIMTTLQAEGVVRYERSVITIKDRPALEQRSCGCCEQLRHEYQKLFAPSDLPSSEPVSLKANPFKDSYLTNRVDLLESALTHSGISWWDVDIRTGQNVQAGCEIWSDMLGYDVGTFKPTMQEWDQMVHPDDQARREAARAAHFRGETPLYECEYRIRHKDGHWVWLQARGKVVARDGRGQALRMIGTNQDITARKQSELALEKLSRTDYLTQAANRMHFFEVGERELARAQRYGTALSLLCMDLDHFKTVNDQHGHAIGDQVLQHFAQLMKDHLRLTDVFARLGGEEFCLLLPHTDAAGAALMAQRILESVRSQPVITDAGLVHYTVSIGIGTLSPPISNLDALLQLADQALYQAKALGRNRAEVASTTSTPAQS